MAEKSPQAFRTIREVAEWLDIEAHVLRFWESKFTQIKPVKRAGGRRYYRPADMKLIGGIKVLLHDQGLTIRGAQKKLADEGVAAMADLSPPLDDELEDEAAASTNICAEGDPASDDVAASQAGFFDIEALANGTGAPEAETAAQAKAPQAEAGTQAEAPGQPGTDAPEPAEAEAPEADPSEAAPEVDPSEAAPEPDPPETEAAPVAVAEPEPTAETVQSPPPAPAEEPPVAAPPEEDTPEAPEAPAPEDTPETAPDPGPGAPAAPPPTPLSELRALLHEAVPLSDAQRTRLTPMIERLEALETRLRSRHPGE